ncbi:MAG: hypothetical protein ABI806_01465 [Candidatus Solibacter sp.]
MGGVFDKSVQLRKVSDQIRLDFIWTDLGVILTFAAVAETAYSMGRREHAERTLTAAEKGYSDMLRYFYKATGLAPEIEETFQAKFRQVRERLDGLQRFR